MVSASKYHISSEKGPVYVQFPASVNINNGSNYGDGFGMEFPC